MFSSRSPPKHKKLNKGGSSSLLSSNTSLASSSSSTASSSAASTASTSTNNSNRCAATHHHSAPLKLGSSNASSCRNMANSSGSTLSLYSNASTSSLLDDSVEKAHYHHHSHMHHSHHHHHHHSGGGGSAVRSGSLPASKRNKKQNWGNRERAGMSFLIVIAFFAVFGLIILTELFMIDERSHTGASMLRHGGSFGTRLGDSMPDYDNVKDDYDLLDESLLGDNKLGFVQLRDNKLKIQDAASDNGDAGRLAGILLSSGGTAAAAAGLTQLGIGRGAAGGGVGNVMPLIPWGKVLPPKVEATLPRYAFGAQPSDGDWQIVNGTRFKFFVFSAYYDRRDSARLVRVIGATKTRSPERVWCRFWYAQRNGSATPRYTSATVMARVKVISENWNLKYSACFVLCPVRAPELEVPHAVSVVARLRAPPGNRLLVRNTDWDEDFKRTHVPNTTHAGSSVVVGNVTATSNAAGAINASASAPQRVVPTGDEIPDKIAICVKPFHFNYDQALYLMEYLEFYALLGVSHFTFYNHTIGPHATCVLEHYMSGDVPGNLTAWDVDLMGAMPLTSVQNMAVAQDSGGAAAANANANYNRFNHNSNSNNNNSHIPATAAPPSAIQPLQPTPALKQYKSTHYTKPTINILPWNLRMRSQKEIRTEGLFAALNDCLYRNMYRYKYVALVDLDEFIVPRHNDTLNELINSLNQRFRNRKMGAYSFQNAFFYLQFPDDPLAMQSSTANGATNARIRAALVTQRKTRRRFKLHPQKQRSKYICKPEAVVEAGNHFVWEFSPGKGSLNVPPTDAILQHYRVCEFGGNDCIKAPSVVDQTATKYVNRLVQRVETVYNYLKQRCNLPELPALPAQKQQEPKQQKAEAQQSPIAVSSDSKQVTKTRRHTANQLNRSDSNNNNNNSNNEHATISPTNTLTTTTAAATTTLANATNRNQPVSRVARRVNFRKKRKVVVFELNEEGAPRARVEYVDK